ncbi:TlpA family protein disulfide reductase [Leptolinea tardivitalis]|uniref:Thioredoxin domain-containing protein n=1 Tax=Leptolinea tardivitalis TaxID=229920 RepID=A0A0N8GKY0_9CHLR|nr:TlpA disulfide reductase family protein [Leptolinea tardivitalis]KPL70954.1 hypothetical protein ADM99_11635 [Leptolinea tardivitalis]GAP22340.1 peroxiredoxin [Leptolinea tardivitalis]
MKKDVVDSQNQKVRRHLPVWIFLTAFIILGVFLGIMAAGYARSVRVALSPGEKLPELSLTSFTGTTYHSMDLKNKVVVIHFWASWCQTCEEEMRSFEEIWQQYKKSDQFMILGVDYVDTEVQALPYLKRLGITYPNGPDLQMKLAETFRVTGVPETFIFDRSSHLAFYKIGPFASVSEIKGVIEPLLVRE